MRRGSLSLLLIGPAIALICGLMAPPSALASEEQAPFQIADGQKLSLHSCKEKPRHQRDITPDSNQNQDEPEPSSPSPEEPSSPNPEENREEENNPPAEEETPSEEGSEENAEENPNHEEEEAEDSSSSSASRNTFGRNDPVILDLFNNVVEAASSSTVEICSGRKKIALGTVIDAQGWIMTKASELEGAIQCRLADGRTLPAEIIGVDDENDLALLRIEADDLKPAIWREGPIKLGSWLAVPSPTGEPVSIGVVSVIPREIAFQPGLLGILIEEGETGPSIGEIVPGSAAEEAGLLANDIVIKVNDVSVLNRENLIETVRQYRPGTEIAVTILRDGAEMVFEATLHSRGSGPGFDRGDYQDRLGGSLSERRAGFTQVLQHDCILRPSECGGPLVDLEGAVVGINIARAGRVNSYTLPVDLVLNIAQKLSGGSLVFEQLETAPQVVDLDGQIQQILERIDAMEERRTEAQASLRRLEAAIDDALEEANQADRQFDALKEALSLLRQQADSAATDSATSN